MNTRRKGRLAPDIANAVFVRSFVQMGDVWADLERLCQYRR